MLWAIGAMDQLASGSKVSKQIIIKEKKKKLNYAIVRQWGQALYLLVQTTMGCVLDCQWSIKKNNETNNKNLCWVKLLIESCY